MMYERKKPQYLPSPYSLEVTTWNAQWKRQRWLYQCHKHWRYYIQKETRAVDQNPPSSTSLGKPATPFSVHNTDGGSLWKSQPAKRVFEQVCPTSFDGHLGRTSEYSDWASRDHAQTTQLIISRAKVFPTGAHLGQNTSTCRLCSSTNAKASGLGEGRSVIFGSNYHSTDMELRWKSGGNSNTMKIPSNLTEQHWDLWSLKM